MPWPKKPQKDDSEKLYAKKDEIIRVQLLEDEPEIYHTHYFNNKTEACKAPDCNLCTSGVKRDAKCKIKVRDMADKKEKLLAGSAAMFQAIHEVVEMVGGRSGSGFAIKRTGEKTATRYSVTALPLTASAQAPAEEETPF